MKLQFRTSDPAKLCEDVMALIETGDLDTWSIADRGKKYLKHSQQWGNKGYLVMNINYINSSLDVHIRKHSGSLHLVSDFEGYYIGRFCELILVYFQDQFTFIAKA